MNSLSTWRRFLMYGIGFAIGYIIYLVINNGQDRVSWLPSSQILHQLQTKQLLYTEHSKERMNCREITEAEIKEILKTGDVNFSKSEVDDKPCPTYAIEGTTSDNQHVRIVFANCDSTAKVVTAIDLDNDHNCK